MLTTISWQLVAGGLVLVPVALLVEGAPPALSATNLGGLLWLTTMGTAVAYYCWFRGLVRMPAGAVAIVGLVNPVVGTLLGVLFAGELFGWAQALGMVLVLGGVVAGQRLAVRPQRHPIRGLETTVRMTLREPEECRAA
jgi:probable blue pigment (indigoidine) exporter